MKTPIQIAMPAGTPKLGNFLTPCKKRAIQINEILEKESLFLKANSLSLFFLNIFHSKWMLMEKGNHQG